MKSAPRNLPCQCISIAFLSTVTSSICINALAGRHVYIIADADEAGAKKALAGATLLHQLNSLTNTRTLEIMERNLAQKSAAMKPKNSCERKKNEWTTLVPAEIARRYQSDIHGVFFLPTDWPGYGSIITVTLPECVIERYSSLSGLNAVSRLRRIRGLASCGRADPPTTPLLRKC